MCPVCLHYASRRAWPGCCDCSGCPLLFCPSAWAEVTSGTNPQAGLGSKLDHSFTDHIDPDTLSRPACRCLKAQRSLDSRADAPVLTTRRVAHIEVSETRVVPPLHAAGVELVLHPYIRSWMPQLGHQSSLGWRQTTGGIKPWKQYCEKPLSVCIQVIQLTLWRWAGQVIGPSVLADVIALE